MQQEDLIPRFMTQRQDFCKNHKLDSPLHHSAARFHSLLQYAAARFDSPLHNAAESNFNSNIYTNLKLNLRKI
jgi:hypothetical protein